MRILGVDGGIASVGWAVAEVEPSRREGRIVAAGTWMFESPEEPTQSGPKLKNADRRMFRGQRRVVHRRAQRMRDIRLLFRDQGLIATSDREALRGEGLDPWFGPVTDWWAPVEGGGTRRYRREGAALVWRDVAGPGA